MKKLFVAALVLAMFIAMSGFGAQAGESYKDTRWTSDPPRGEAVLADALIGRPMGIGACALGIAGTVVAFPFALIAGDTKALYKSLIADPAAFTFKRPLGQLYDVSH